MTREEAKEFLMDMSYKLSNTSIEYLSYVGKMREAIKVLYNSGAVDGKWLAFRDSEGKTIAMIRTKGE